METWHALNDHGSLLKMTLFFFLYTLFSLHVDELQEEKEGPGIFVSLIFFIYTCNFVCALKVLLAVTTGSQDLVDTGS